MAFFTAGQRRQSFTWFAAIAALLLACVPATWAGKLTDHSCYTSLDPATATSMNCYNTGLTGAFPLPVQKSGKLQNFRPEPIFVWARMGTMVSLRSPSDTRPQARAPAPAPGPGRFAQGASRNRGNRDNSSPKGCTGITGIIGIIGIIII